VWALDKVSDRQQNNPSETASRTQLLIAITLPIAPITYQIWPILPIQQQKESSGQ
jgi:hypothetical protein